MANATTTAGAALACAFVNLDSKKKKSIKRLNSGTACKARSSLSGRCISLSGPPGVCSAKGSTMRYGKNVRRDQ